MKLLLFMRIKNVTSAKLFRILFQLLVLYSKCTYNSTLKRNHNDGYSFQEQKLNFIYFRVIFHFELNVKVDTSVDTQRGAARD